MKLNEEALKAAYAAAPTEKRDMNFIAVVIRSYIDADKTNRAADMLAMQSALSALKVMGVSPVTSVPIYLLQDRISKNNEAS